MLPLSFVAAAAYPAIEASHLYSGTQTLGGMITSTTGAVSTIVPDLGVFLAAAVVLSLAVYVGRRVIRAGR